MALSLSKQSNTYGITLSYWNIQSIHYNHLTGTSVVFLSGYPSQEIRNLGSASIETISIEFNDLFDITIINQLNMNPIRYAYMKIKAMNEWKAAGDI